MMLFDVETTYEAIPIDFGHWDWQMMRKVAFVMTGIAVGAACAELGQRALLAAPIFAATLDNSKELNFFALVLDKVRASYLEKPDEQKLTKSAINGMLASLDPYSIYFDKEDLEDHFGTSELGTIGIDIRQEDSFAKVIAPFDDSPAARAGLLSGDLIAAIDGESVQGMTTYQASARMRGAINTPVKLAILRGKDKQKLEFSLVRGMVPGMSVRWKKQDGDIGYIRIPQLNEGTSEKLKAAMTDFQQDIPSDRFKGFILDLRNSTQGSLDESIEVVSAFIDRGEVVSTRGRIANDTQHYNARSKDLSNGKPVIVLINAGSAAAAEIVAGALQDHKRAMILGSRSFGKGAVQTIFPIGTSALRMTTARYYTPSGRLIEGKGITPDIVVMQDVPGELKGSVASQSSADPAAHLKNAEDAKPALQSYVPPDVKNDKQLIIATQILHGLWPKGASAKLPTTGKLPN
jgi:carboxyl-terminal processing protease